MIDKLNGRTQEAAAIFAADRFATEAAGIRVEQAGENYARCAMKIEPRHLNANGMVMGGAVFTLADFTFAVATNMEKDYMTVSVSSNIQFLRTASAGTLYGESSVLRMGRTSCVVEINVTDDTGRLIAKTTMNGLRTKKPETGAKQE